MKFDLQWAERANVMYLSFTIFVDLSPPLLAAKKIQSQFEYVIKDGARGCKFLFNPPEILEPLLIGAKAFRQRNCWEAG